MLNQTILVGRIMKKSKLIEKNNNKICDIDLSISRNYKDNNGEYKNDIIKCRLFNKIAETASEYMKEGDLVGVKGKIRSDKSKTIVIAESLTFLSKGNEKNMDKEK